MNTISQLLPIFGGFRYRFRRIWSRKKVSVLVLEILVSEKSNGFSFREFGLRKKVTVSVSENLVSEKSLCFVLVSSFSV